MRSRWLARYTPVNGIKALWHSLWELLPFFLRLRDLVIDHSSPPREVSVRFSSKLLSYPHSDYSSLVDYDEYYFLQYALSDIWGFTYYRVSACLIFDSTEVLYKRFGRTIKNDQRVYKVGRSHPVLSVLGIIVHRTKGHWLNFCKCIFRRKNNHYPLNHFGGVVAYGCWLVKVPCRDRAFKS